jgi:hypothetical protein
MSNCNCSPSQAACDCIAERERQKALVFGGVPSGEFDKKNSQADWITYVVRYSAAGAPKLANRKDMDFRTSMVKVAALAIAAIENFDAGNCP